MNLPKSKPSPEDLDDPMLARPFTIRHVVKETHDTFSFELEPETKESDFTFAPGQFNMLYVYGVGEVPISISGDPASTGTLVHTVRTVGTVTQAMRRLKVRSSMGVRGPYGTPWPVENAVGNDIVIVTGGIGLAPLRPAIHYVLTHRDKYGKVVLLYGARTPEDILFRRDLERWRARLDLEVLVTVDRATSPWRGNVGVVTTLIGKSTFDPLHSVALVCGPEIMMRYTVLELEKRGIEDERIYVSLERNMKCGVGLCGHCQLGPTFVCKDGPVYCYREIQSILTKREM
jgi:NAD(P)H-flavin reductase